MKCVFTKPFTANQEEICMRNSMETSNTSRKQQSIEVVLVISKSAVTVLAVVTNVLLKQVF